MGGEKHFYIEGGQDTHGDEDPDHCGNLENFKITGFAYLKNYTIFFIANASRASINKYLVSEIEKEILSKDIKSLFYLCKEEE